MKHRRTWILTGAAAAAAVFALTACSVKQEAAPEERQQLEIWHYWEKPASRAAIRELADEYERTHADIEIVFKYVSSENFKKRLALGMAEREMPDIAIMDSVDVPFFYETGYLADVSDLIDKEEYLDVALEPCLTENGGLAGIPVGLDCLVFYYNRVLLEQAGIQPPKTLDEFFTAAEALSSDEVYGCAFPSLQSEESLFCFLPILYSKGGSIDELDSPESREAFAYLHQLTETGAMSKSVANMNLADVEREFRKGRIAMMFGTTQLMLEPDQENEDAFEMAPVPVSPEAMSIVGGEVLTVMDGEHQEEAKDFARYMLGAGQMERYAEAVGYMAPKRSVLEKQIKENRKVRACAKILKTAHTREFSAQWPLISMRISETISRVIAQEDTPETYTELAEEIQRIRGGAS